MSMDRQLARQRDKKTDSQTDRLTEKQKRSIRQGNCRSYVQKMVGNGWTNEEKCDKRKNSQSDAPQQSPHRSVTPTGVSGH